MNPMYASRLISYSGTAQFVHFDPRLLSCDYRRPKPRAPFDDASGLVYEDRQTKYASVLPQPPAISRGLPPGSTVPITMLRPRGQD